MFFNFNLSVIKNVEEREIYRHLKLIAAIKIKYVVKVNLDFD